MNWYRGSLLVGWHLLLSACATSSPVEKQGSAYRIVVPDSNWVVEFPEEGFKVNIADTSRHYYYFSSPDINVSFSLYRATRCTSSESCRDYQVNRLKARYPHPRKHSWAMSQVGDVFVSADTDGEVGGVNLRQRHWNAHYVRGALWVELHLSKVDYRESHRELFEKFIRSVEVKTKTD